MPPDGPQSKALPAKPMGRPTILRKFAAIADQIMNRNGPLKGFGMKMEAGFRT
jgi:hypothetical protein